MLQFTSLLHHRIALVINFVFELKLAGDRCLQLMPFRLCSIWFRGESQLVRVASHSLCCLSSFSFPPIDNWQENRLFSLSKTRDCAIIGQTFSHLIRASCCCIAETFPRSPPPRSARCFHFRSVRRFFPVFISVLKGNSPSWRCRNVAIANK